MNAPIRLAVIDDHPLFREGVTRSLVELGGFEFVGEGGTMEDAVLIAHERRPDIVLLDISMPGGGLNAITPILTTVPDQKIVMLTISETTSDLTLALSSGAKGYVLKGVGSKTLAEILTTVAGGETYVSPALSARMLQDISARTADAEGPLASLTRRELGILELVASGMTNKRIARELDLHEKTVKHHMTRVLAKLGLTNRTEAAIALRNARGQP